MNISSDGKGWACLWILQAKVSSVLRMVVERKFQVDHVSDENTIQGLKPRNKDFVDGYYIHQPHNTSKSHTKHTDHT
jgi:hypothetical protein